MKRVFWKRERPQLRNIFIYDEANGRLIISRDLIKKMEILDE